MKTPYWIFLFAILTACSTSKEWTSTTQSITEGLHDIEVLDNNNAIAYSYGTGNLYKTTDAGKNWNKLYQFDSIYFEQIQFLDSQNGWLIGSPNKIYKTSDGGKTWLDKSLEKEFNGAYLYGMYFKNVNNGYIAALQRGSKGMLTKILQTKDGGTTWQLANQLDEMILNLEIINGSLYGTGNNVIIKNIQDKDNWEYVYQDKNKKVGQIRDIAQIDNNIIASSFNGYIINLSGANPQVKQITKNRIRNLVAVNSKQWIAVGDADKEPGNLFVSNDSGNTWITSPKKYVDIHRIQKSKKACPPFGGKLWIVGKEGLVMTKKKSR